MMPENTQTGALANGDGVRAPGVIKGKRAGLLPTVLLASLLGWPSSGISDVTLSAPAADRRLTRDLAAASLVLHADSDGVTSI